MMPETISSALRLYHMCQQTKHGASQIKRNRTPGWWCYYEVHRTSLTTAWGPPYYYTICRDTDRFSFFSCCSIPLLWCCCRCISFNFTRCLYSIAGQSINQWLNSIWEPAEFAKSFPVSDDNFIQCEKGDSREREENFKKRVGVGTRHFNSRLPLRCPVGSDRAGDPTNPIIITHTSYIAGIRSGPSWESACG